MLKQFEAMHFVGVGGIGMSGLAKILLSRHKKISGSDLKYNALMQKLEADGAQIFASHAAEHIPQDTDYVVVSTAISTDNPEIIEAQRRHIPIIHRADVLNYLLTSAHSVSVTGTHGKTTTTSLLSLILKAANLEPSVVIGGEVPQLGTNAIAGKGDYLVAEVDESDQSLRKLSSEVAVITNIEVDHLDHYKDLNEIIEAVAEFVGNQPANGKTLVNFDDPGIRLLLSRLPYHIMPATFGLTSETVDYKAESIILEATHSNFTVVFKGQPLGQFRINVPGIHNVYNALSAIACSHAIGLDMAPVIQALAEYGGVKRRFQLIGQVHDISVIDDYAHHPSEIKAALNTARLQERPITIIFQPHRFSRTQALMREFSTAFQQADRVILTDIYAASEKPEDFPVSIHDLREQISLQNPGKEVIYLSGFGDIAQYVCEHSDANEMLMTVGAGNITELSTLLVEQLAHRQPKEQAKECKERKIVYAPLHRSRQERKVV